MSGGRTLEEQQLVLGVPLVRVVRERVRLKYHVTEVCQQHLQ